jgi:transcriptional regulator with XRE-family HTH domain
VDLAASRLAIRLRELRLAAGLTQAALAQRARVTTETVARLERAVRSRASANVNPSLDTLSRLAGALAVEVADLLRSPDAPSAPTDGLASLLRHARPETTARILRVAEALMREEDEARPRRKPGKKRRSTP